MFFVLKLYFAEKVNAVKKIQGMDHPTAPGRYKTESDHFYGLCYISGEGASTDALEMRKMSALARN